jgi:hypothetical protein
MTPLEFLAVVLPSPGTGYYCAVELTRKNEHAFVEKLEDLLPHVDRWNKADYNIFFALSTFAKVGKRTAENTLKIKAFFIDMDGYESKKSAAIALDAFMEKVGLSELGKPWIVSSGGGLHCYWPLTEELPTDVWKPVADNLKRLCAQEKMSIDMSVTSDSARVMRFPETFNHKKKYSKPMPVKLLAEGDIFKFEDIAALIDKHLVEKPDPIQKVETLSLPGARPSKAMTKAQVKLIENSTTLFASFESKCGQVVDYLNTAQDDGKEPVWRGLLSWAKVCNDGEEKAVWLSEMHPYPPDRMHQKLAEIKGPYSCVAMDSLNPGICTGCPHWGKITNPLILGRELKADNTEKVIPLATVSEEFVEEEFFALDESEEGDDPDNIPAVRRPLPPRGYSYGENGGVYFVKEEADEEGKKSKKTIQLVPYDLFVVDLLKMENEHLVHMAAVRPEGVLTLNFPQKSIVSRDETLKWLASQNIVSTFAGYDKQLYEYVRACVGEASQAKKPIVVPYQCGWQEDNSFVYNNRVFTSDGRETRIPMPGLENINRNTNSDGDLQTWKKLWQTIFVDKPNMETALAVCLDSFGAPLMRFTEYEGFVWHIGSRESGTGKSLVLSAKAGVWGHPLRYRTGKGTSPVAMQQRAGLLNSMPLLVDEITNTQRANMEWAPVFIFDFAEAQGKERMDAGANKERLNNTSWKTTCTMTSNESLTDYMAGARKFSSNGELLRMLEWNPNIKLVWTPKEREVLLDMKRHYGVAGEAWVRWLTKHREVAQEVVAKTHAHLKKVMNFDDDERYWHAGCTIIVASAILLRRDYANILDVEVQKVINALKLVVDKARGIIRGSVRTAEDVLNAYTGDNYGSFIIIKKADGRLLAAWGDGESVDKSLTRSKVLGRVEHGTLADGFREYYIEEQLLKKHCVSMSFSYDEFKKQMEKMFRVKYTKKDMLGKTNGPVMRVNAMHITFEEEHFNGNNVSLGEA